MMTKWELKEQLESLRETNSKLTDANLVIAKQLENLWSEVGYKNDRVRDLTYEVSELKSEVKTLKFKWRKCIADRYAQDQEEKEKDKALIDKEKSLNDKFFLATNDYLLSGGDNMFFLERNSKVFNLGYSLRDAFIDYTINEEDLESKVDNRFIRNE